MSTASPSIYLIFQDTAEHAPQGPGWYLSVPDPAQENQAWAIEPVKVDIADVLAGVTALDGQSPVGVRDFVATQSAQVAADLAQQVAQKQALLAEIEQAERTLAALRESGVQVGEVQTGETSPVEQHGEHHTYEQHGQPEHHAA